MGLTKAKAEIGINEANLREVEFLVDTGSFYTFLPPAMAKELGIAFPVITEVITADSRKSRVPVGVAYMKLLDREAGIILGTMDVPRPLLGASALEVLGFKVNPVTEKLEHTRPFGPAAL